MAAACPALPLRLSCGVCHAAVCGWPSIKSPADVCGDTRLGLTINNTYQEGQEAQLATAIVANDAGISPVAWEHDHIPDIAANIPVVTGVVVPTVWPGDRFDIIWCFTLAADEGAAYHFAALPELLLSGDAAA